MLALLKPFSIVYGDKVYIGKVWQTQRNIDEEVIMTWHCVFIFSAMSKVSEGVFLDVGMQNCMSFRRSSGTNSHNHQFFYCLTTVVSKYSIKYFIAVFYIV